MAAAAGLTDYGRNEAFAAILIGEGPLLAAAAASIDLLGGRTVQRLDWRGVAAGIETAVPKPVLVVEAGAGSANEPLSTGLAALDAFATDRDLPVVVTFGPTLIDVVTANLFGRHVQPLCDPSMAERIAALAVAAELTQAPVLHDPWRESETSRLHRLNQEVARIAELLARLTRDDPGGSDVADRRASYGVGPWGEAPAVDPQEIRQLIRRRRLRDQFFAPGLFEDPAWDMLLDLYAAELEGARVSVSSLCIAAAVPPTTALRWIGKLSEAGLLVRQPDPHDRRRAFMALAPQASGAMRAYMVAVRRIEQAA